MKKIIVAGSRKGATSSSTYNLNINLYENIDELKIKFSWIDGPDGNHMRKGSRPLTLNDIIDELNIRGFIWCENDDFLYCFKLENIFIKNKKLF